MKYILYALPLLSLGCSESNLSKGSFDTGFTTDGGSGETLDDTDADTGMFENEPAWWSLGSRLSLEKGTPQVKSTLSIVPLNDEGEPLCEDPAPFTITEVTEEAAPYTEVLVWWRLGLEAPDTLCDGISAPIGDSIYLGVGEMHPDISAAIEIIDGLDDALPLNGAYASLDGSAVYVFGVAGQDSAYAGEGEVAESAPLADGGWRVEPVYWFSY